MALLAEPKAHFLVLADIDRRAMSLLTSNVRILIASSCVALGIAGCGGGGGGGDSSPGTGQNNPPPAPPPSNASPTIQGEPIATVLASDSYSFEPAADDPDGDSLTFTVENLPGWAFFDEATGALSGTPTAADVGTYDGITITVSDGTASASLGAFSITVSEVVMGAATLSWDAPTANSDGTPLTDLAGFQIRYGRSSSDLSESVSVDLGLTTYMIENLAEGTWYFAVVAVNSSGVMSASSNVASKTIS